MENVRQANGGNVPNQQNFGNFANGQRAYFESLYHLTEQLDAWVNLPEVPQNLQNKTAARERVLAFVLKTDATTIDLDGLHLTTLPDVFGHLGHLKKLTLFNNEQLCVLPESILSHKGLEELDVRVTSLTPEYVAMLRTGYEGRCKVTESAYPRQGVPRRGRAPELNLEQWAAGNACRQTAAERIRYAISESESWRRYGGDDDLYIHLDLAGLGLDELPEDIGRIKHLETLNLFGNPITHLPLSMRNLHTNCSVLISPPLLGFDHLDPNAPLEINPQQLVNLFNARYGENPHQQVPRPAQPGQQNASALESELSIWATGKMDRVIAVEKIRFCILSLATSLDLSGLELLELPLQIGHLSHLTHLNVSETGLAHLPESITQLALLAHLNVNTNQLNDETFALLNRFVRPINIDVRGNNISGRTVKMTQKQMAQNADKTPRYEFSKSQKDSANVEQIFVKDLRDWAGIDANRLQVAEKIELSEESRLPTLDLTCMSINSVPDIFTHLPWIKKIDLSNNQFKEADALMRLGPREVILDGNPLPNLTIILLQDRIKEDGYLGPRFMFSPQQQLGADKERQVQAEKVAEAEKQALEAERAAQAERAFHKSVDNWADIFPHKKKASVVIKRCWTDKSETLKLNGDPRNNGCLQDLPPVISQMTYLKRLDLSYNLFSSLPSSIGNLHNLLNVNLTGNRVNEIGNGLTGLVHGCQVHVSDNAIDPEHIYSAETAMDASNYRGPKFKFSERQKISANAVRRAHKQREQQANEQARQQREKQAKQRAEKEAQQRADQEAQQRAHEEEVRRAQADAARLASEAAERARQQELERERERLRDPLNANVEPMPFNLGANGQLLYVHAVTEIEVAQYVIRIVSGGVSGAHIARLRRDFHYIVNHGGNDECDWFMRRYANVFDPRTPINGANAIRQYTKLIKALAPHDPTVRRTEGKL
ncbi:MAG: hypothetical protein H7252_04035 [Cytophaga sp.]|nr:hypothetical protein [Undibacterium sp.]